MSGHIKDLSFWLTYRKRLTDRFMPDPKWLPKLYHLPPFWYDFSFVLQSQQTLKLRQAARYDGWLVSIAGLSNQIPPPDPPEPHPAGFQIRMLDIRHNRFWSRPFIPESNFCGTGSQRTFLRVPERFHKGDAFQIEMTNLSTNVLKGSVTMEAVHDGNQRS